MNICRAYKVLMTEMLGEVGVPLLSFRRNIKNPKRCANLQIDPKNPHFF